MTVTRPSAVAGSFYPAQARELSAQVSRYLAEAAARRPAHTGETPKALIVPHAGYVYSGPVAASAYARLIPARGKIQRVVLIGPSHRLAFRGLAVGTAEAWSSPLGAVMIDRPAVERLMALPMVVELDDAHAQEHALEVQLPFLQILLGDILLVPVVAGDAHPDEVAAVLDAVWGGEETLIVVSTDLSHYLDYDAARALDAATGAAIARLDESALGRGQACGRIPLGGLMVAARRHHLTVESLDLRNSGDTAGSRDRVVGYGAWALYPSADIPAESAPPSDPAGLDAAGAALIRLAWDAIHHGLKMGRPGKITLDAPLPDCLTAPGAAFVTLKRHGHLRGCIGSAQAWRPLVEDVTDNAYKAAFSDPRFPGLTENELDGLVLSVSVLTPPQPMTIHSEGDLLSQLRPGIDGLIIEDKGHRALFLPSVWEQLPDPSRFLAHLKAKAGLPPTHWSPNFRASRFQAVEIRDA